MTISVYDTFCGSLNSGDGIIMEAVAEVLDQIFPLQHKVAYPTHYPLSFKAVRRIRKSSITVVGGTNLLSSAISFWPRRNQWAVGYIESLILKKRVVLLGCGWKEYQGPASRWARLFYRAILSEHYMHSVRDSYTEQMLRGFGFSNVVNTGCPTMWGLSDGHCLQIPEGKGKDVVFTLTDYRRAPKDDLAFIEVLKHAYRRIYFWAQGSKDLEYFSSLLAGQPVDNLEIVGPSVPRFDGILRDVESIDYVGTRLHAGMRALQMKRRAIIIGVDNRAVEKRRDFNLQVVERGDIDALRRLIYGSFKTQLWIPNDKISAWKSQF